MRYFVTAVLAASIWLSLVVPLFAQTSDPNMTPRPVGDNGWCTVTRDTPAGTAECGFGSAAAACDRQISSFYPKGSRVFSGLRDETSINSKCDFEEIDTSLELFVGVGPVSKSCDFGFSRAGDVCRQVSECTTCNKGQEAGNPINFISGEKKDVRIDYQSADGRFVIKRHYNSAPFASDGNGFAMRREFGHNWFLGEFPSLGADIIHSPTFSYYYFSYPSGYSTLMRGPGDVQGQKTAGNLVSPFRVEHPDGPVGSDTEDRRVSILHNNGKKYNFEFPPTRGLALRGVTRKPLTVDFGEGYGHTYAYDAQGSLESITDSYGRQATFEYDITSWRVPNGTGPSQLILNGVSTDVIFDGSGRSLGDERQPTRSRLKRINFPDGTYTEYDYDSVSEFGTYWGVKERLIGATKYSEAEEVIHSETYHYEDPRILYALTGITDDAGIRFATWSYDEQGRANMSEHAGGVNRVDILHNDPEGRFDQTTREVTNALGYTKTYNLNSVTNTFAIVDVQGEGTADVKSTNESYFYVPGTGGIRSSIDPLLREDAQTLNERGLRLSKTYAEGTSEEFTSTYEWHPRFNRPTKTVMPGLTTDYAYDDDGRILEMVQTDTSANAAPPREWSYTWAGSNLASVDGPLPGTVDVTRFEHLNEKLISVENEVGHVTQITAHNPIGAPTRFTDPNGVETQMRYDARHRLTSIERAGAITQITYSPTDLTTSITLPNGNRLGFQYNDGRQLIAITNGAGERVDYTRNAMGGILSTRIPDSSGTIQYSMTQVRDEINRVVEAIGVNWASQFEYDEMNNLTDITDPRGNEWKQNFDNLDRLKDEIDPLGGTTDFDLEDQMDGRNPLNKVTDQRGVETNYVRNGYGEVIREISLEAGTTEYVRDEAGRIIQMTDARGVVSDYAYDGMDRLLSVTYPAAAIDDITYGYDAGSFGIGELTSITEGFGASTYGYNSLAQMVRMTRIINGVSYVCEYEYDLAGEVTAIIYPSGRRIEYSRDGAAREIRIRMVAPDGTATILADGISYKPFGPIDSMSLGDGHDLSINYDVNYRAVRLQRSGSAGSIMDLGFTYDEASDITGLQDNLRPERSQILGYDALSRLTEADGGYGSLSYGYNPSGDRTSRDWTQPDGSQKSETYTYDPATARLSLVAVEDTAGQFTPIREFEYHASGQVSSDLRGANTYLYGLNDRGRLTTITRNGTDVARYTHDATEQRIVKTADGKTIHYHYDLDGRLISETDGLTGDTLREYVWLGLMPIAIIDATQEAPDTACEADIAAIQAQLDDRTSRIDNIAEAIARLFGLIIDKEARIDTIDAAIKRLETLITDREARIATNAARITELGDLIVDKEGRIDVIDAAILRLTEVIADREERIATNAARIIELDGFIAVDEAELATLDPTADAARITLLTDRIAARSASVTNLTAGNERLTGLNSDNALRITELTTRNGELAALITAHETRSSELSDINAAQLSLNAGHTQRIAELTTRNAELAALVTGHEERISFLSDRNFVLAEQRAQFEIDLADAEANCETVAAEGLYYLHADHLGRPQFATDPSGAVVWDMGEGVTPFGDSVNLAGAFAQQLMFPGQYADLETGGQGDDVILSHNWHRTYDPTLGRYLQSDPIGLAGGLNRYAYVGGNPVGAVDPTGELFFLAPVFIYGGAVFTGLGIYQTSRDVTAAIMGERNQYGNRFNCYNYEKIIRSGAGALNPLKKVGGALDNLGAFALIKTTPFAFGGPKAARRDLLKRVIGDTIANAAISYVDKATGALGNLNFNDNCECQNEPPLTSGAQNSSSRAYEYRPIEPKGPSGHYIPRPGYDPVLDPNVSIVTLRALRGR